MSFKRKLKDFLINNYLILPFLFYFLSLFKIQLLCHT